ncbi:MAG: hypothetical protein ACR2HG_05715 [Pyrinomonadaceae bacterium]
MKKYFLIAFFGALFFTVSIKAQSSDLTWQELKKPQTEERVSLENTQRETLNKIIETQMIQLETLKGELVKEGNTSSPVRLDVIIDRFIQERKDLISVYSQERTKLMQAHSEERKVYLTIL